MGRQTEKQFQAAVVQYAKLRGWHVRHTYDSRRSAAGEFDLRMVRGERMVVAELKVQGGRLSPAQKEELERLETFASGVNKAIHGVPWSNPTVGVGVHVWRPDDWPEIEDVLK